MPEYNIFYIILFFFIFRKSLRMPCQTLPAQIPLNIHKNLSNYNTAFDENYQKVVMVFIFILPYPRLYRRWVLFCRHKRHHFTS